jgi:UDP-N-acetylmuramate: L-alanyl-gamma-D-glutamyl-meso-diaminopimelate ligase
MFEPRSLTAGRELFFDAYCRAFANADVVLLAPIFHHQRLGDERLDRDAVVSRLRSSGVDAAACVSTDEVLAKAVAGARPGDVLVTMSSGSFDGLPRRLLAALG